MITIKKKSGGSTWRRRARRCGGAALSGCRRAQATLNTHKATKQKNNGYIVTYHHFHRHLSSLPSSLIITSTTLYEQCLTSSVSAQDHGVSPSALTEDNLPVLARVLSSFDHERDYFYLPGSDLDMWSKEDPRKL